MTRKPRYAEDAEHTFKAFCSRVGVLPQTVSEDETGWDCLVQFPLDGFDGPAEEAPPDQEAMIQVKSTIKLTPSTKVKLSNVVNMCKDPKPWFLVLMHRPKGGADKWYVHHVNRAWMEQGLAEARAARIEGVKLNRRFLSVTFNEHDEHSADLLQWIEAQIAEPLPVYGTEKLKHYEECGYEDGHEILTFEVDGATDEVALAFLGKQKISAFNLKRIGTRFGIADKEVTYLADHGQISLEPLRRRSCRVLLEPEGLDDKLDVEAYCTSTPFPLTHDLARLRIDAGILEFLMKPGSTSFDITFNSEGRRPLQDYANISKIVGWASERRISVTAEAPKVSLLKGSFGPFGNNGKLHITLAEVLSFFVENSDGQRCETTLSEIWEKRDRLANAYSVHIPRVARFEVDSLLPHPVTTFVFGASVQIGDCIFLFVTRRRVNSTFEASDGTIGYNLELPRMVMRRIAIAGDPVYKLQELVDEVLDTIGPEAFGVTDILDMVEGQSADIRVGSR